MIKPIVMILTAAKTPRPLNIRISLHATLVPWDSTLEALPSFTNPSSNADANTLPPVMILCQPPEQQGASPETKANNVAKSSVNLYHIAAEFAPEDFLCAHAEISFAVDGWAALSRC
jgi:hypothetical protein